MFVSWLLSATMTESVRSLLSEEGVRWFFGSFSTVLASSWLVNLLLLSMAGGCLWLSGVLRMSTDGYRERMAASLTLFMLFVYAIAVAALTFVPHAVLLSATGQLFPSPFSRALLPIASFGILTASAVHGWASGRFVCFSDFVNALSFGIARCAPLFVVYVVAVQFLASLRFVFG